ncbi:MAG TPA: trypsin-like peptidase domain-containing protein [Planctomycetota bacterium]|nr:trypsin-like peptidase domain-containing protein [Planctomycetota bacterium]
MKNRRVVATLAVLVGVGSGLLRSGRAYEPEAAVPLEETLRKMVERVAPSVVRLQVDGRAQEPRPERRFFRDPSTEPREGGAGIVIRADGLILTHASLVAFDLPRIEVLTGNGRRLPAELVATDTKLDVALVKADPGSEPLPALELGTASDLVPGRLVLTFGNPFGVARDSRPSSSLGVVRSVGPLDAREAVFEGNVIAVDAAVNPGNEGGPLVDLDGRVLGVLAPLARDRRSMAMLGYAIPIDAIAPELERLGKGGRAASLGLFLSAGPELVVARVIPQACAEKAGVKEGDRLVSFDGTALKTKEDLKKALAEKRPGNKVTLELEREGTKVSVEVVLGGRE